MHDYEYEYVHDYEYEDQDEKGCCEQRAYARQAALKAVIGRYYAAPGKVGRKM